MQVSFLAKTFYKVLPALGLMLALSGAARAQDSPPSGAPEPSTPATGVPIDGGASLLLAGGVAYGLKKLRQRRRTTRG